VAVGAVEGAAREPPLLQAEGAARVSSSSIQLRFVVGGGEEGGVGEVEVGGE